MCIVCIYMVYISTYLLHIRCPDHTTATPHHHLHHYLLNDMYCSRYDGVLDHSLNALSILRAQSESGETGVSSQHSIASLGRQQGGEVRIHWLTYASHTHHHVLVPQEVLVFATGVRYFLVWFMSNCLFCSNYVTSSTTCLNPTLFSMHGLGKDMTKCNEVGICEDCTAEEKRVMS